MPKKAKSKERSKPKLNIKKSKKGRAAPPKRRKVAVSIPALEAAATKAADFAAKHEAAAAESKGAAEQRRADADAARHFCALRNVETSSHSDCALKSTRPKIAAGARRDLYPIGPKSATRCD
jgi:hypothetical protein